MENNKFWWYFRKLHYGHEMLRIFLWKTVWWWIFHHTLFNRKHRDQPRGVLFCCFTWICCCWPDEGITTSGFNFLELELDFGVIVANRSMSTSVFMGKLDEAFYPRIVGNKILQIYIFAFLKWRNRDKSLLFALYRLNIQFKGLPRFINGCNSSNSLFFSMHT